MKRILKILSLILFFVTQIVFSLPSNQAKQEKWLNIDYSDLVDKSVLLRTGQSLGSGLGNNSLKGALQPFLDKYSNLLECTVEMVSGEEQPFKNVVDKYPIGSAQPAWVALFRNGRIAAFTDQKRSVRLFLPGTDPQRAYSENYSIVRHMLNTLKPFLGKLQIEVYVYQNDYRNLFLQLNPVPVEFHTSYFGTPTGKIPLDLNGLRDFFNQGGQLEGAQVNDRDGLLLYAKAGATPTLAGRNVQLADFAVAYRAVFHAGDNKAFISLDPHKDVTKAAVNFGGFLEDTAIGRVVLEADKRFKTITSGLDPNSCKDIRSYTRQFVPNFLTVSERDILSSMTKCGWVKTRFWFYPDSIEVQTDTTKHFAKIINPQFLADAERSRDDFNSSIEFEKKKKALLLPAIRENIADLNRNFSLYADAFLEFRELLTVGRLMAICSWLNKINSRQVDLDALLAVELPPISTERDRTQLIASTTLSDSNVDKTVDNVKRNLIINYLSPDLDKTISGYFTDKNDLATFLALKSGNNQKAENYFSEASVILRNQGGKLVRSLIKNQAELQQFAIFAGQKKMPLPSSKQAYQIIDQENKAITAKQGELTQLDLKLQNIKQKIENQELTGNENIQNYNLLVEDFNKQNKLLKERIEKFNQRVMIFNQEQKGTSMQLVEIGGGINLEAESFKISTVANSPQLNNFKTMAEKAKTTWTNINEDEKWITSKVVDKKDESKNVVAQNLKGKQTKGSIQGLAINKLDQNKVMDNNLPEIKPSKRLVLEQAKQKVLVFNGIDPSSSRIKAEIIDARHIVFRRVR